MSVAPVSNLLDALGQYQLLAEPQLQQLRDSVAKYHPDPQAVIQRLVRLDLLTAY